MNLVKLFITLVLALFLSSCAMWSNPYAVSKIPASALNSNDTGIVIMSTGTQETCSFFSTHAYLFNGTTHRPIQDLWSHSHLLLNHTSIRSEFETHHGVVNALALEPGSYYFYPNNTGLSNDIVPQKVTNDALAFQVKGGETTYLGELYMTNGCTEKARYTVRDQYERDIAFISKQNPSLLTPAPVKRLLENMGPLSKRCDGINGCQ